MARRCLVDGVFLIISIAPFETEDRELANSEVHAANNVFA